MVVVDGTSRHDVGVVGVRRVLHSIPVPILEENGKNSIFKTSSTADSIYKISLCYNVCDGFDFERVRGC